MKIHRNEKYIKWGLTGFLVFVACSLFWIVFSNLRGFYDLILEFVDIISSILYGCFFAYLMNPIAEFVSRLTTKLMARRKYKEKTVQRTSKIVGIVVSVLVLVAALYALVAMIVPSIFSSLEELLQQERLEKAYNTVSGWVGNTFGGTPIETWFDANLDSLLETLTDWLKGIDIGAFISGLTSSLYSVVMGVFNLLLGIVAAIYILIYKKELCAQTKKMTVAIFRADHANRLFEVARRTNKIFGGYVIGKLLDSLIVGVVTYIGMLIMGLPYAMLIAVLVGVTNIIPFFGPLLGMIPSALLLLIDKPIYALWFMIFILILQQIDGNILQNRILGEKLGISDLWVLVSILVFGGIFGVIGMLLGVPIFAVIYTLITDRINKRLNKKGYPTPSEEYYSLKCVEDLPVKTPVSASFASVDPAYDMTVDPKDDEDYDDE